MPIIVDSTNIQYCEGVTTDSQIMSNVTTDGTDVYTSTCEFEGCIVFNVVGTFTWDVPSNVHQTKVCMIGGGGAGGITEDNPGANPLSSGGGYRGTEISQMITVTPGGTVTVGVGKGGSGIDHSGVGATQGEPGDNSSFHGTTASGGTGGGARFSTATTEYYGNGGTGPGGCGGGGYVDGIAAVSGSTWKAGGGQASSFGSGGNALIWINNGDRAGTGGIGAGGGGAVGREFIIGYSGNGGRGEVRVGGGCLSSNIIYIDQLPLSELLALGIKRID